MNLTGNDGRRSPAKDGPGGGGGNLSTLGSGPGPHDGRNPLCNRSNAKRKCSHDDLGHHGSFSLNVTEATS